MCFEPLHDIGLSLDLRAGMDVVGLLDSILSFAEKIQQATDAAKSNKDKCLALSDRVRLLSGDLATRIKGHGASADVLHPLQHAEAVFKKAFSVVEYYGSMNRVKRFVHAKSIKDDFEHISKDLDSSIQGAGYFRMFVAIVVNSVSQGWSHAMEHIRTTVYLSIRHM